MNAFEQKVYRFCRENALFRKGDTVCVAFSGGADSTALLLCLQKLQGALGISLSALHVNHHIRGEEANGDAAFCQALCRERDIPFTLAEADVPSYAKKHKLSLEGAARQCRYLALGQSTASVIATAHTASDNAETVLYNLVRGAGLSGLCGIPLCRDLNGKRVVRPILSVTREETEGYCKACHQAFVTDSTNLTDDGSRNFLRHQVVPLLKKQNPSFEANVFSATCLLSEDEKALEELSQGENDLHVSQLQSQPPAVAKRRIKRVLEPLFDVTREHIQAVLSLCQSAPSARAVLPKGYVARREYDKILVEKEEITASESYEVALNPGKNRLCGELYLHLSGNVHNAATKCQLDCDTIVGQLVARSRREKDEITLPGGTKTVKALMIDQKIPKACRDLLPVLCDDEGIVAVANCGVAKRCRVGKNTKNKVVIQLEGYKL